MPKNALVGVLAGAMMFPIAAANATLVFQATLSGAAQIPTNASKASGTATVTLENDSNTLDVDVTFAGLEGGPATAGHIHCCAPPGANAGVLLPFSGFPSATSGTYAHTFDLAMDLSGISVATLLASLEDGLAYVNIHNAEFTGGEIRGQLVLVPEPAAVGIVALGAIAAFLTANRQRPR
jgi:hypothetical protein